jgi:hypothetical protein
MANKGEFLFYPTKQQQLIFSFFSYEITVHMGGIYIYNVCLYYVGGSGNQYKLHQCTRVVTTRLRVKKQLKPTGLSGFNPTYWIR